MDLNGTVANIWKVQDRLHKAPMIDLEHQHERFASYLNQLGLQPIFGVTGLV